MGEVGREMSRVENCANLLRKEVGQFSNGRDKLGGEGKIIQIDESLMRSKRENNRGRLLLGDEDESVFGRETRRNNYGD